MKYIFMQSILIKIFLFSVIGTYGQTYYVDPSRPDNSGAGTSWATAKKDLQNAINAAASGNQVWVKAGTYKPTQVPNLGGFRDKAFFLKDGVAIYGGFVGTETSLSQRNWVSYPTIISVSSNGHNIIFINDNLNSTAILYGFTIMSAVNTKTLYVRIVQVDKAGNQQMSKVIKATVK